MDVLDVDRVGNPVWRGVWSPPENLAGPTAGFTYAITATTFDRTGAATVTYDTVETFLLDARNATPPAAVTFSANGTNASKNTTATPGRQSFVLLCSGFAPTGLI